MKPGILLVVSLLWYYSSLAQKSCMDIHAENLLVDKQSFDLSGYDGFLIGESHRATEGEELKLALLKHLNKAYKDQDEYKYFFNAYSRKKNKKIQARLFSMYAIPGCDYQVLPMSIIDNQEVKKRGISSFYLISTGKRKDINCFFRHNLLNPTI